MKLTDLEFIRLLPQFMRDDAAVKGLAAGIDKIVPQLAESLAVLSTWDHIDELDEAELDALAWELNIQWYDQGADIDAKRDVIRNSDQVYQHLGTKWAVENVVRSYFNEAYIKEWFEYGGEPGRFSVYSKNTTITGERLRSFLHLLNKVKRASAKLEAVWLDMDSTGTITYGACAEMGGRMDVWPLVARQIESSGTAATASVLTYSTSMEIYPEGGIA